MFVCMVSNGPYAAEGWMNFLEDEDDVWLEAFETDDHGAIDLSAYDEFENIQDLVNFVAGTGSYSDRNSFVPTEEDKDMRKREMHNDSWKVPEKLEKMFDYLDQGEPYKDIDVDPTAKHGWNVSERDAKIDGHDTKYTAHFIAYDPDEDSEGGKANFYFAVSWYDTDPSEMNIEDGISFDDIDTALEDE